MANPDSAFGARLIESEGKEYRVRRYPKKSGNIIAEGDFVIADAAGTVDVAIAGGTLLGVSLEYKAATNTDNIAIVDDPEAVYDVQANGQILAADVFQNADIEANASDASLLRSKHELDVATLGSTATLQLKVLGLTSIDENEYGSFARVKVKINNHIMKGGTGSIGV